MEVMKTLLFLVCCSAVPAGAAGLAEVRSVYLMPMGRGFDQYLANRLTNEHVFQVVTDPKLADAVVTDRLGEAFEQRLESIAPAGKPPAPPAPAKKTEPEQPNGAALMTDTVNKLDNPATHSSFGSAKGTVFLVDPKSHQVIWSVFEPPKSPALKDLDRAASDIVSRLKKDLNPKK